MTPRLDEIPEPKYNRYGQMWCHCCGCYSDIIYPVHLRNQNGRWISLLCDECVEAAPEATPKRYIDQIGEQMRPDPTCPAYLKATRM